MPQIQQRFKETAVEIMPRISTCTPFFDDDLINTTFSIGREMTATFCVAAVLIRLHIPVVK